MKKNKLSIYIIARNAEKSIENCLKSCSGLANEIILVTNDSQDRTIEIAESYGVKCYENKWVCYRDQKSFALNLCSNDWVLSIDSDECLSSELKNSIGYFLNSSFCENFFGGSFNRKSYFLGKWVNHGDWYPDKKVRLSRRAHSKWSGLPEHDLLKVEGSVYHLNGDLLHYSFENIDHLIVKTLAFSNLFVERIKCDNTKRKSLVEILFRSFFRFFRSYILKFGFLDGHRGLIIAVNSSFFVFVKYMKAKFD